MDNKLRNLHRNKDRSPEDKRRYIEALTRIRDPRKDPKPGDRIKVAYRLGPGSWVRIVRIVTEVTNDTVKCIIADSPRAIEYARTMDKWRNGYIANIKHDPAKFEIVEHAGI